MQVFELKKGQTKQSFNGLIKEERKTDIKLKFVEKIPQFTENYIHYINNERLSCKLNYKTPAQYRIEQGLDKL